MGHPRAVTPGAPFRRRPSSPIDVRVALSIAAALTCARIPGGDDGETRLVRCAHIGWARSIAPLRPT